MMSPSRKAKNEAVVSDFIEKVRARPSIAYGLYPRLGSKSKAFK
jgi:hypothetical protein